MLRRALFGSWLFLLASACASGARDYQAEMAYAPPGETRPIEAWLSRNREAPAAERSDAYYALCETYQRGGDYVRAAEACTTANELLGDGASSAARQAQAFYATLARAPAMVRSGVADEALSYGWTGMAEINVIANGQHASWGVDTGAEITTITESDARQYGARILDDPLQIHGSTPGATGGRVAIIDELRIGNALVRNVSAFVLPDEALTSQGRRVPPILGLPVLLAFERVEFTAHGTRLRLGSPRRALRGRLRWNPSGVAISVALAGGEAAAHLDTGANLSELQTATIALLSPEQRSALVTQSLNVGGVTGQIAREVQRLALLDLRVGDGVCRLDTIAFGPESAGAEGRLGIDVVKACETFALDFEAMRFGVFTE